MDTDGTCVIVATPFESHEEAATILTDPIKPISSQFRPSYSLAVNLIARGAGKLDVAKQLVRKSFAMWEKQQLEGDIASAGQRDGVNEILEASSQEKFMTLLTEKLRYQINKRSANYDAAYLQILVGILNDRDLLKKSSKSYVGASRLLELEHTTLSYLEMELKTMVSVGLEVEKELMGDLLDEDQENLMEQIELQRKRVGIADKDVRKHPFTRIVETANDIMGEDSIDGRELFSVLRNTRTNDGEVKAFLTAEDLTKFSISAISVKRKMRKLATANPDLNPEELLLQAEKVEHLKDDDSWDDMIAITKVLVAYGCLSTAKGVDEDAGTSFEEGTFEVTPAGVDVGMLGFENSLWCFVAMGGTWDVTGASSKLDEFKTAMETFDDDKEEETAISSQLDVPNPQQEAEQLVSHLRSLDPSELAGYVSCLVSDGSRGNPSVLDMFQKMTPRQQRAIQSLLIAMERLVEVQRQYSMDEKTSHCPLDITNREVVTAWASGCSWSEALEISGAAPGDLARILSRALDAVRQFGNLKYTPIRREDMEEGTRLIPLSRGLDPQVRRSCREAAKAMNRYPVKDPLPFATAVEDDMLEEAVEDDENGESEDAVNINDELEGDAEGKIE
jgi:hypothetical protein